MQATTLPGGAIASPYHWDPEIEGPAWLNNPQLAEAILAEICREHLFRKLTGYYDRRDAACDALKRIDPDCPRRHWIRIGMALKHEFAEEGWFQWNSWSRRGKKYDPTTIRGQWDSFRVGHANPVTIGTILHLARRTYA